MISLKSFPERKGVMVQVYNAPRWVKFAIFAWTLILVFYLSDTHISLITKGITITADSGGAPAVVSTAIEIHTKTVTVTKTRAPKATAPPTPASQSKLEASNTSNINFGDLEYIRPERTLITYVYSESKESRANLKFFLAHALHGSSDFVFILNGKTSAAELIPNELNVKVVKRDNSCYDLGSHAEVLTKNDLYKQYTKFILMNASVRGPFIPHWSDSCWSDQLVGRVTDEVKLVGISINCWPTIHVQSMVWATDLIGLELLLYPPSSSPRHDLWMEKLFKHPQSFTKPKGYKKADPSWHERGLNQCFSNRQAAVEAEISATGIIFGAGKKVDVMLMKFQTDPDYEAHCDRLGEWDPQAPGGYDGIDMHVFETMFTKTNRGISPRMIELMTEWVEKSSYSSYDVCH